MYSDEIINTIKIFLINTTKQKHYNGWTNRTTYGYHSFKIQNIELPGQRQPWVRLNKIKKYFDFTNKTLIDFGCNTGGMVFHLPELKTAYGLDFNTDCIKSCNYISSILQHKTNYYFFQQDLNNFDIKKFINEKNINKIDVIFLLSLGSWIKNWKELYNQSILYCNNIILETNNDDEGRPQLTYFESLNCNITLISNESDDDITRNVGRKTYLITQK